MPFFKQFLGLCCSTLFLFSCGPSANFEETTTDNQADSIVAVTVVEEPKPIPDSGCIKVSNPEWTKLMDQQRDEIKNTPDWYASLDKHIALKTHACFGKSKEECLLLNAEFQLVEIEHYCKPEDAKAPCATTTEEQWSTLLVAAMEEVKADAAWYGSIDGHMKDPKHPCSGKSKEECLKINAEHLLMENKNYCKPQEAKGPCTPTDKAKWASLFAEAKQTIKDDAKWYSSLDEHMQDVDHSCMGKSKEECLNINAEYFLLEVKNFCKPK